jgi:methionine sulfoxide reductase heme-binding subunit
VVSSAPDPISLAASHVLAAGTSAPSPLWYTTRATGVVALILLTATVALGVAGIGRLESRAMPRLVSAGLHRNLSLLAVAFVATHVLTSVLDPFAGIGFISAVIPFTSPYRPLWISLGAIAFDMLVAVVISSLLRAHLSYRAWRGVHWLAYACWPVALWHGLGAGTDSRLSWLLLLDAVCVAVVVGAVFWRLQLAPRADVRTVGRLATAAFVLATIVFVATGPVQVGWARRAGTPARIVGPAHASNANASVGRPGDSG